jgi:hypothetical protein
MTGQAMSLEELRRKVEACLQRLEQGYELTGGGEYWVRHGSTLVVVRPLQHAEVTMVRLAAPVAINVTKITPELTRFLLEKNHELLMGKFSLDTQDNTIWYEHALLGDFLDASELFVALAWVATKADEHDEQVSTMAGGRRIADVTAFRFRI